MRTDTYTQSHTHSGRLTSFGHLRLGTRDDLSSVQAGEVVPLDASQSNMNVSHLGVGAKKRQAFGIPEASRLDA